MVANWKKLYLELADEVEQVLGKALGYPYYSDDQKNFPGATEEDGVCVGDHVPESILAEAAKAIKESKKSELPEPFIGQFSKINQEDKTCWPYGW